MTQKLTKKKMLSYAVAGGAAFGFAQDVDADLVFNDGNLATGTTVFDTSIGLDIDGDGTIDFQLVNDLDGGFLGTLYAQAAVSASGSNLLWGFSDGYKYANALATSSSVSAGMTGGSGDGFLSNGYLWDGNGFSASDFPAGSSGFFGVQFDIGGNTHFGFVEVFISDAANPNNALTTDNAITLLSYAYQDVADAPAHIEPIPEPGSLGLLALGAIGIGAMRRRKNN